MTTPKRRPSITLKVAMTLDGYVATASGESQWITQEPARAAGHQLRAAHDGILVGRGTVLADNPRLTTRSVAGPSPRVCVLDSNASLANGERPRALREGSIVLHAPSAGDRELAQLAAWRLVLCCVPLAPDHRGLDLHAAMEVLAEQGVARLLVEGGASVLGSFVALALYDELHVFLAPRFFGSGMPMLASQSWSLADAPELELLAIESLGPDLHLRYAPLRRV